MKEYGAALTDFFCAAMFLRCAWIFGVVNGVQEGRGYYVLLGLVWLAGALIWAVRGVCALRREKMNQPNDEL